MFQPAVFAPAWYAPSSSGQKEGFTAQHCQKVINSVRDLIAFEFYKVTYSLNQRMPLSRRSEDEVFTLVLD
jgi:hypothetical protein